MDVLKVLLLTLSANLDVFVLGFSCGLKKHYLSFYNVFIISVLTLIGTFLSMMFGQYISRFFPWFIGSLLFILIGIYGLIKTFINKEEKRVVKMRTKEAFTLGVLLAINNASLGLSSSFINFNVVITSFSSFGLCFLLMFFGNFIGTYFNSDMIGKKADVLSSIIIIILGVITLII